jgi:hypothetical protein
MADILIISGDLTPGDRHDIPISWGGYQVFREMMSRYPHPIKIVVFGPNEVGADKLSREDLWRFVFPEGADPEKNIVLHDVMITVRGVNVYGFPWTRGGDLRRSAFVASSLEAKIAEIPLNVNVLITNLRCYDHPRLPSLERVYDARKVSGPLKYGIIDRIYWEPSMDARVAEILKQPGASLTYISRANHGCANVHYILADNYRVFCGSTQTQTLIRIHSGDRLGPHTSEQMSPELDSSDLQERVTADLSERVSAGVPERVADPQERISGLPVHFARMHHRDVKILLREFQEGSPVHGRYVLSDVRRDDTFRLILSPCCAVDVTRTFHAVVCEDHIKFELGSCHCFIGGGDGDVSVLSRSEDALNQGKTTVWWKVEPCQNAEDQCRLLCKPDDDRGGYLAFINRDGECVATIVDDQRNAAIFSLMLVDEMQ